MFITEKNSSVFMVYGTQNNWLELMVSTQRGFKKYESSPEMLVKTSQNMKVFLAT